MQQIWVPTNATPGSARFDVYSAKSTELGPGVTKTAKLDLGMKFAKKYVCRIYPRPALSLKLIFLGRGGGGGGGGGGVDSDYRGNISVILTNLSSWNIKIGRGDRIAQIIFF